MLSDVPSALHPSSALFWLGHAPDYVCQHKLISTSKKNTSSGVTAVEGEWLAELEIFYKCNCSKLYVECTFKIDKEIMSLTWHVLPSMKVMNNEQ